MLLWKKIHVHVHNEITTQILMYHTKCFFLEKKNQQMYHVTVQKKKIVFNLPFHSQNLKANSPNWRPYISLLASPENLVLYKDNIP